MCFQGPESEVGRAAGRMLSEATGIEGCRLWLDGLDCLTRRLGWRAAGRGEGLGGHQGIASGRTPIVTDAPFCLRLPPRGGRLENESGKAHWWKDARGGLDQYFGRGRDLRRTRYCGRARCWTERSGAFEFDVLVITV